MPEGVEAKQTMGRLETGDDSKSSDPDSLQRALEIEVVAQLREQNARLLEEPETYRQLKHTAKSGDGSSQSWVEIRDVQSGDGIDGQGCKTPRNTVTVGNTVRYTPNGTQVPTGTPPTDERPEPPAHVSVPPVPPFPTGVPEDATKFLDGYESFHQTSKMRVVDQQWKPGCEGPKEPTPSEARTLWLEREVQALRNTLASVSHGNSFQKSEYWNGGFQRSDAGIQPSSKPGFSQHVNPDLAEAISRAFPGEVCHQGRAGSSGSLPGSSGSLQHKDCEGHLRGGCGEDALLDRASAMMGARPSVCPGNSLGGSGDVCAQARALGTPSLHQGVCQDGRALSTSQLRPGVCQDDRALGTS